MPQTIGHIALVVRDYDEAIAFFTQSLGFELIEDSISLDRAGLQKRWVLVAPPG
jgi:catechol 2,3-dioxygenase-like lactoylglutathione lyase family enzyme